MIVKHLQEMKSHMVSVFFTKSLATSKSQLFSLAHIHLL